MGSLKGAIRLYSVLKDQIQFANQILIRVGNRDSICMHVTLVEETSTNFSDFSLLKGLVHGPLFLPF